jgi:DHA1 family multidrug resistance protein-like MFS transporter
LKGEKKTSSRKTSVIRGNGSWKTLFASGIMMLLLMLFLQRIIRTIFNPFIPLYIQEMTGTIIGAAEKTGYINGLVGFVTAVSAVLISRLGDKYNKMRMIRIMLVIGFIDVLLLCLFEGMATFVIFYTTLFFIIGGIEPLITSTTAEMTPADQRGTLFGIQGLVGSLGWMVSPTLGTYISIKFGLEEIFWALLFFVWMNIVVAAFIRKRTIQE